jgi:hypothetical protein
MSTSSDEMRVGRELAASGRSREDAAKVSETVSWAFDQYQHEQPDSAARWRSLGTSAVRVGGSASGPALIAVVIEAGIITAAVYRSFGDDIGVVVGVYIATLLIYAFLLVKLSYLKWITLLVLSVYIFGYLIFLDQASKWMGMMRHRRAPGVVHGGDADSGYGCDVMALSRADKPQSQPPRARSKRSRR